jgi:hypothetical protein
MVNCPKCGLEMSFDSSPPEWIGGYMCINGCEAPSGSKVWDTMYVRGYWDGRTLEQSRRCDGCQYWKTVCPIRVVYPADMHIQLYTGEDWSCKDWKGI